MVRTIPFLALMTFMLSSCTPTTRITGSWTNPDLPVKTYNQLFIAAMTSNVKAKDQVEEDLAASLRQQGIAVTTSRKLFPPNFTQDHLQDKRAVLERVREENHEAILTISLIDQESESRYVPGSYGYAPMNQYGWYGSFWGYYSRMYPMVYEPGYYTEERVYFIETNLYDTATEKLIWSAQSESYDPTDLQRFSEKFAEIIIEELRNDGFI